jgi:hypothetical protein
LDFLIVETDHLEIGVRFIAHDDVNKLFLVDGHNNWHLAFLHLLGIRDNIIIN